MDEYTQQPRDRRPDALGALQFLPDEIICMILEALSPCDIANLACVSSVLYIFCNEEQLWMKLCLENFQGPLEYKGSWKQTTIKHLCLTKNVAEISQSSLHFEGFYSLFLYRRWYRCRVALQNFSFDNGDVERRGDMSSKEFLSQYDGKRPVLFTALANDWGAKHNWTVENLLERYGDIAFRISQSNARRVTMKLKNYVSYMRVQHDEDPLYIFDPMFGEVAPDLLKDYNVPHLFQEDLFDVLDNSKRPPFRWLVLGPAHSGAPWHVDPALTSAWNTLIQGRKRWALYPPCRVPPGVTVHVNEEDGDVNIESPSSLQWWLDIYPLLAEQDRPLECTQLPGETIFVPSGWWHCVLNLDTSVAVTQNFVNMTNFEFVCLDMAPGYRHKGVARAGLLALQEQHGFSVDNGDARSINHGNVASDKDCNVIYSVDFLSLYLEENRNHYSANWCEDNPLGQREVREWLYQLWAGRPALRKQIWKGASIALNADQWLDRVTSICAANNLPFPSESDKLPVGNGSNPVYLIGDYVIKLYVEGGMESAVHSLGSELEFYNLLKNSGLSLINHVPQVLATGILCFINGSYESVPWDGKGVPPILAQFDLFTKNSWSSHSSFSTWNKANVETITSGQKKSCHEENCFNTSTSVWPYLITKRCKGENFAHIREKLSKDEYFVLASFLGEQVRNLHSLRLPPLPSSSKRLKLNNSTKLDVVQVLGNQRENILISSLELNKFVLQEPSYRNYCIPEEWQLFMRLMQKNHKDIKEHLKKWGDAIPKHLRDTAEEYLPRDPILLLNISRVTNGVVHVAKSATWLHMDIMDDNIQMEPYLSDEQLPDQAQNCSPPMILMDENKLLGELGDAKRNKQNVMHPSYILDFSDLFIGDPIYELIAVYIDVFRGDSVLLKHFLASYKLPLHTRLECKEQPDLVAGDLQAESKKLERLSYHAMCYCLLHEDDVLGAIFSIWTELSKAISWEEVELAVWGALNDYQGF